MPGLLDWLTNMQPAASGGFRLPVTGDPQDEAAFKQRTAGFMRAPFAEAGSAPTADVSGAPFANPYLSAIKRFEGFTPRATWDYKQPSSGYGTRAAYVGETIDRPEAERRFSDEIGSAHREVVQAFPNLSEPQRAALTSLTFNAGSGWMNAGLGNAIRSGDWPRAQALFTQYNKAGGKVLPGLVSRRGEEAKWLSGTELAQSPGETGATPPGASFVSDPGVISASLLKGQQSMPSGLLGGLQQGGGLLSQLGVPEGISGPFKANKNAFLGYLAGALQGGNLGQSIGRGLGGMVEGSQIDTKRAGTDATEQALAQSGMNPAFASAIAKNPHALAAWQALNPELKIQTVADSWGNQSVIGVNPRSGVGSPITMGQSGTGASGSPAMKGGPEASVAGVPSAAQAATQIQNALASGETDPEKLARFIPDTGTSAYVKALLRGDALPSNLGSRAGAVRANAIQFAHIIDPNFREEQITERQAFAKNMSSAAPNSFGSQVRGSGTVVKHIGSGLDNLAVITKGAKGVPLGMGEYGEQPELNAVRAAANRRANDQEYNKAYGGYRLDADAVAGEVVRLLTGGQGSEKDRKQWQDKFDLSKNSLSEVRGAWNEAYTIMHGRLSEVAQQKSRAYNMEVDPFSLLSPGSEKIAAKVRTLGAAPGTEGAPGDPAAPTAPAVPAGIIKWERGPDGKPRPMVQQ